MSAAANVASIEAVRSFRASLAGFGAEARESLCNQDLELRRGMQWLLAEQPEYWQREIRQANDEVLEAKNDLRRCRGMTLPDGTPPSCMEEKKDLDMARRKLAHAEEKIAATQKWGRTLEHEALEYSSRATQLQEILDSMLPRAIGMLDRALAALESYTTLRPPERERVAGGLAASVAQPIATGASEKSSGHQTLERPSVTVEGSQADESR